jgi:SAM-dependent methyltransferase
VAVIPFYGAERPDLFQIERAAMDRPGYVLAELARRLPLTGLVLDVGAGDGYLAEQLTTPGRRVYPVEPEPAMIRSDRPLPWVRADAERLPFRDGAFEAAYATWAYFFTRGWNPAPGLRELHRVVKVGGRLLVVDNLGGDEFTSLAQRDITADPTYWKQQGFRCHPIDTWFEFDNIDQAKLLLGFYFGERAEARQRLTFRVGLFISESHGPS